MGLGEGYGESALVNAGKERSLGFTLCSLVEVRILVEALVVGEACSGVGLGSSCLPNCGSTHICSGRSGPQHFMSSCDPSRRRPPSLPHCSNSCQPSHLQSGGSTYGFRRFTSCPLANYVLFNTCCDSEGRRHQRSVLCAGQSGDVPYVLYSCTQTNKLRSGFERFAKHSAWMCVVMKPADYRL
jgi:hypothetical protein